MAGIRVNSRKRGSTSLVLILLLLSLVSCGTARPITNPHNESDPVIDVEVAPVVKDSALRLSASFEILSDDLSDINKLKGLLRLQKDSLIWINLTHPGGIPVARGLFTLDSFFVQNRIEKEEYSGSYSEFNAKYGLPLNFQILQSVLLSETLPDLNVAVSLPKSDSLMLIAGYDSSGANHVSYLRSTLPDTLLLQSIFLFQDKILEVNYENHLTDKGNFAQTHKYLVRQPAKAQNISLIFSKIETGLNLSFPYQKQK